MTTKQKKDTWNSQTGAILAVIGSAVGLANFLRFPGLAAEYGGGAFMFAYFISLVLLAVPIAWAEWTMGRYGGQNGFSSCPGILNFICKHPIAKYLGILGVLVPLIIYMYYSYVESWCLGYAVNFLTGQLHFENIKEAESFWVNFIGAQENGSAFGIGWQKVGIYLFFATLLNFTLVYRGISKGIEFFCRIAVPTLILIALIVLIRVLTLGAPNPEKPEHSVANGLGFMWNPTKVLFEKWDHLTGHWVKTEEIIGKASRVKFESIVANKPHTFRIREVSTLEQLKRPQLWLAAASQVFFSLSVGLGLIITYSSYMKKDDDVVLSSLCSSSANEFCEVGIGGLLSLPAAYAFIGAAGIAGMTSFGLGFKALPMVFSLMPFGNLLGFSIPLGNIFGFLFFFLLFLAAVNGSISCLQPSIAFLEETLKIERKQSVSILGCFAILGCLFVVWFSKDAKALETFDFWAGQFLVFVIATIQIIVFGWVLGVDRGFEEAHKGAAFRIPNFFKFIIKYICPLFLLTIFTMWVCIGALGIGGTALDFHVLDLMGVNGQEAYTVAWSCILIILFIYIFMSLISSRAKSYKISAKEKL